MKGRTAKRAAPPLIRAVRDNDAAGVIAAVRRGADVNAPGPGLTRPRVPAATALMEAAARDRPRIAELLIELGADVSWQVPIELGSWRDYGYTALMVAAWRGHAAVVEVLLEAGAQVELDACDPHVFGCRALHYAVRGGDLQCVRLLLRAGADANARTRDQRTAIQFATGANSKEMARELMGNQPRKANSSAALLEAAEAGNLELVKMFLRDGADANASDSTGESALTLAARYMRKDVAKALLKAGADPNVGRAGKDRALMFSAQHDWPDLVKALLEAGAEVNAISWEHQTALDIADAYDNPRCLRILKRAGGKSADDVAPRKPVKIPRAMAADEVPMAPVPDLSTAARSKSFRDATTRVRRWTATDPIQTESEGVVEFELIGKRAQNVLKQRQSELLAKGFYLVVSRRGITEDDEWTLTLVASRRWEDVVAAARTNGSNIDVGSRKIISQMKIIEKETPFVLTGAGPDFVEGQFVRKVKDAAGLAKRIAKLSPDIVSQGTETVERLAEILKRDNAFRLWWE